MRMYLSESLTFSNRSELKLLVERVLEFSVRGIPNIFAASVIETKEQRLNDDGSIKEVPRVVIIAEGFNMSDIYRLQHNQDAIDYANITIDNPVELFKSMGYGAAKHKLINEIT